MSPPQIAGVNQHPMSTWALRRVRGSAKYAKVKRDVEVAAPATRSPAPMRSSWLMAITSGFIRMARFCADSLNGVKRACHWHSTVDTVTVTARSQSQPMGSNKGIWIANSSQHARSRMWPLKRCCVACAAPRNGNMFDSHQNQVGSLLGCSSPYGKPHRFIGWGLGHMDESCMGVSFPTNTPRPQGEI